MSSVQDPPSGLDRLPPDQRAVLQLVLARGQSFDEIARMLRMERTVVRQRALDAVDTLGPATRIPAERRGRIADYLLGQLSESEGEDGRKRLATSARERAWARVVSSELAPLAVGPLPEIPVEIELSDSDSTPSKRTTRRGRGRGGKRSAGLTNDNGVKADAAPAGPAAADGDGGQPAAETPGEEPSSDAAIAEPVVAAGPTRAESAKPAEAGTPKPPSDYGFGIAQPAAAPTVSRLGGAILLGAIALAVIAVIVIFVIVGVGGGKAHRASARRPTLAGTSTSPTPLAQINMTSPNGGKAVGIAEVISAGGARGVVIIAQGLSPNANHDAYAIWLYNSPHSYYRLGYVQQAVTSSGRLQTGGRLPSNASSYKQLVVALQNGPSNKPGTIVLQGGLSGL